MTTMTMTEVSSAELTGVEGGTADLLTLFIEAFPEWAHAMPAYAALGGAAFCVGVGVGFGIGYGAGAFVDWLNSSTSTQ